MPRIAPVHRHSASTGYNLDQAKAIAVGVAERDDALAFADVQGLVTNLDTAKTLRRARPIV